MMNRLQTPMFRKTAENIQKTAQNVGELHLFSSRCDANTSHSTASTPKAMRSNRTGRTILNRLFL